MSYLIAGVGAFLSLLTYLWRRSVKKQDVLIDDLTGHLEEERKKLYAIIERKNKYIRELEESLIANANPAELLNGLFSSSESN